MGYTANRTIQSLYDPAPLERAVDRLARAVGEDLTEEVRRRTPVAEPPPGWTPAEYAAHRQRSPGTMKASWRTGQVRPRRGEGGTEGVSVESYTDDLAAVFVEYGTKPRRIKAKGKLMAVPKPGGGIEYRRVVDHPGTEGVHMMRDALAEVNATWAERHGRREMERWAREQSGRA